ncbi:DUF2922 domain-containing protein [Alicyclobacillus fastidiosus]|uniref:DUF2922 domain-containing protein n=1 Tax=Alicyclobacillus fastidiosus TaxID=392011 RepID=A0ABV5AGS2_9BACL|nr:DUF2922 domain-containing protein [Alicyclobacillus fastidiosus]WEH09425.1 DUF2922 domain-containing protein [Alicyclobacillus fastidiosus]
MATKLSLFLSFMTDQNKKVRVNIQNPKQPVDTNAVNDAIQSIVNKNVFNFPQGAIVKALPAQETQTDVTTIS